MARHKKLDRLTAEENRRKAPLGVLVWVVAVRVRDLPRVVVQRLPPFGCCSRFKRRRRVGRIPFTGTCLMEAHTIGIFAGQRRWRGKLVVYWPQLGAGAQIISTMQTSAVSAPSAPGFL